MANKKIDLRAELNAYRFEMGLLKDIPCSKAENRQYSEMLKAGGKLPEGVLSYLYEDGNVSSAFYTVQKTDLTDAEISEYFACKQLKLLTTIKNCLVFFTVLAVISLVLGFLIGLSIF